MTDRIAISTVASSVKEEGFKNGKRNGKGQRKERYAELFSDCRAEAKNTDSNNSGVHCYCLLPREDKSLFEQIQPNRQPHVPCNEGEQSVEHLMHVCRILETPKKLHDTTYNDRRRDLAPHKQRTSSQTLKRFSQFVKSIDFSKL